jgi:putative ATPase
LTWEALRRSPEGGLWALVPGQAEAESLRETAARLPEVERPIVLQGRLEELPELLAVRGEADLRFDAIVGRNVLSIDARTAGSQAGAYLPATARQLATLLRPHGTLSLAEAIPRHTQRLYALADLTPLSGDLARRLREAEEAIYAAPDDPLVNWDEEDLRGALADAGLSDVRLELEETSGELQVTQTLLARWFNPAPDGPRPGYAQHLAALLGPEEIAEVQALYLRQFLGRAIPWRSITAYVTAVAN